MTTTTKAKASAAATSKLLAASASGLERLSVALQAISAEIPGRTSTRQSMAFVTCAYLNSMGRSVTLSELRELIGDDNHGSPILGLSVERTMNAFLEPTKRDPEALGWLRQVPDEDDRRKKYLELTPEGEAAVIRFIEAYEGRKMEA
ncbi:hypothetical protein [Caulobacter vibrioides]|uniref:MarR family transcriptional regulator n=1 Tax=Caulobacter phage S2B TaxID=2759120 RepID=A0AAE7ML77_9CAUD|nr:hypothetical protein [Caulobacter vibrioides]QOC54171.1 hypothetical protein [Caulobacter phage S2B]QXZ50212.1 hypothetical protein KZH45_09775 [Caulobacter vibrioides]